MGRSPCCPPSPQDKRQADGQAAGRPSQVEGDPPGPEQLHLTQPRLGGPLPACTPADVLGGEVALWVSCDAACPPWDDPPELMLCPASCPCPLLCSWLWRGVSLLGLTGSPFPFPHRAAEPVGAGSHGANPRQGRGQPLDLLAVRQPPSGEAI